MEWLGTHGIHEVSFSSAQDWISTSLPVVKAEELLNTTYHVYSHEDDDTETLVRCLEWSLPEDLHDFIDTIQPTNSFMRLDAQRRRAEPQEPQWFLDGRIPTYEEMVEEDLLTHSHIKAPEEENIPQNPTIAQACNRLAISPLCIRTMYGTLGYSTQAPEKNSIGLVNYHGQSNNRSDLNVFLHTYRKDAGAANAANSFKTLLVNNGIDDQKPVGSKQSGTMAESIEGALDIQAVIGVSFPTPVIAYNVGGKAQHQEDESTTGTSDNEPYLDWLHYVMEQEELPPVITTSYADDEQTVPEAYARRVCNEFAQLGARGVSIIFASGDDGVGRDGHCTSDESGTPRFVPVFPASCPYVTSVGATRLVGPEAVAFDARGSFVSGGGFSDYFPTPQYQKQHVNRYLQGLDTSLSPYFNHWGRGYPDVSAIGYHYVVVWNGSGVLQDGTSASAPAFASLVALVNDALLAEGKPTLGFLNPLLYSRGSEAFTDVTVGSNFGCNTTGFPARKGWDAASGLGTPVSENHYIPRSLHFLYLLVRSVSSGSRNSKKLLSAIGTGLYGHGILGIKIRQSLFTQHSINSNAFHKREFCIHLSIQHTVQDTCALTLMR